MDLAETLPMAAPRPRAHVAVSLGLGAAAVATLLAGRVAVSIFVSAVVLAAYVDLRRVLARWGHVVTVVLGGAGVAGFLWSGYSGRLDLLASTGAGLLLALLATRVVLHELRTSAEGTTSDIAATLGAACVAGVLGAHVLLIRSVPRFGFRGLAAFAVMVAGGEAVAHLVSRIRGQGRGGRKGRTAGWEGRVGGFAAAVLAGLIAGLVWDPPFDVRSGLLLGAGMGVLVPLGAFAFRVLERSAGVRSSGGYLGPLGGALDAASGALFAAPAFYWALRTLAL